MADTFFIGQLDDPSQVAAATLAMPPFVMLTGFANLFGIGGASLISRALGVGNRKRARRAAVFSIYFSAIGAIVYGIVLYLSAPALLPLLGADEFTYGFLLDYILWTITIGGVPTVMSAALAHLVRAEGYSNEASVGMALGGVMNIILDPVFVFALGLGLRGAAIATMISNCISLLYFLVLIYIKRESLVITFSPAALYFGDGIPGEIMTVGFPSFVLLLMGTASNLVLNKMVAGYSRESIAGMGIAKKIDTLAFAIANGMSQGVLPLIGYNYSSKNRKRMREAIKRSLIYNIIIATVGALLLFTCAVPIVKFFISDEKTVAYGQHFLRTICVTCPAISITMMIIAIFQATGKRLCPMLLSFLRKGGIDIPLIFFINRYYGEWGIPFTTPISDVAAMLVSVAFFIPYWHSLKRQEQALAIPDDSGGQESKTAESV